MVSHLVSHRRAMKSHETFTVCTPVEDTRRHQDTSVHSVHYVSHVYVAYACER